MKKAPDPIDRLVGQNIRVFRLSKGMTQTALGNALDITFQQIQKYENGSNRVGSGRLAQIAKTLDVPVARFFHNRTTETERDERRDSVSELLTSPYALRMLKALGRIPDRQTILSLVRLAESIAKRQ